MYRRAREEGVPYVAVIMDLTIPGGMGGKEAVWGVREIDPAAKVFVSSGYSSDPVMADYRGHGFDGVIAKPFLYEEMVEALQGVIGQL